MLDHLVENDKIECIIGERKLFANPNHKSGLVEPSARDLNGRDLGALADSIWFDPERLKAKLAAKNDEAANSGANIKNSHSWPGPPIVCDLLKSVRLVTLGQHVLHDALLPLGCLDAAPVFLPVSDQKFPQFRFADSHSFDFEP
jgi:hypothetical protein